MEENVERKLTNLLSMASRARRIVSGMTNCVEAIKKNEAKIILVAEDAKDRTKKEIFELSEKFSVRAYEILTKKALGNALGKEERAIVGVLDEGFSKAVEKILSVV